ACMLRVRPVQERHRHGPAPRREQLEHQRERLAAQPPHPPGAHGGRVLLPAHPAAAQPGSSAAVAPQRAAGGRRGDDRRGHLRDRDRDRRGIRHRDGGDRPRDGRPDASAGDRPAVHRGIRRRRRRGVRRGGRQPAVKGPAEPASKASAQPAPSKARGASPSAATDEVTLERVQGNTELSSFISAADRVMEGLGYTEHGFRHANLTARIAYNVLTRAGFDEHTANLGSVAGYLHDVGNMLTREAHGQTGGVLVYHALRDQVPAQDLATIVSAIANHEEENGYAVSPVSAAVILA